MFRRSKYFSSPFKSTVFIIFLLVISILLLTNPLPSIEKTGKKDQYLVIISIDGLSSRHLEDTTIKISNIRKLAKEGARADWMETVFPSMTYVAHTTLITGLYPRRHGILNNTLLDRKSDEVFNYFTSGITKEKALLRETLYDIAHKAGFITASVMWPLTLGAANIDYNLPDANSQENLEYYTTPSLLKELREKGIPLDKFNRFISRHSEAPQLDNLSTEVAIHLIERHRPNLLLVHLLLPDPFAHDFGPWAEEVKWTIEYSDKNIGRIIDTLKRVGIEEKTTVFVVSDHGFMETDKQILPNVKLKEEGLIRVDRGGKVIERKAYVVSAGGTALVYVLDREQRREILTQLKSIFSNLEGIKRIYEEGDFWAEGLPTPHDSPLMGDLLLLAQDGYRFGGSHRGKRTIIPTRLRGAHGYHPSHPDLRAIFIAWGRNIKRGIRIKEVKAVDLAPTAAWLLGLEMSGTEGRVIKELLALY